MKHENLEQKNYTIAESAIIATTCFVLWILCMVLIAKALDAPEHVSAKSAAYIEAMETALEAPTYEPRD